MKRAIGGVLTAVVALAGAALGCDAPIEAGGAPSHAGEPQGTLDVPEDVAPGSLDDLHRRILLSSCAGQPGLCHNGQFEPNLATPAQAYENLVRRPSIERHGRERVAPGAPGASLLIDKLRNRDVISRMPLGADPLPEADVAAIEAWIADAALRRPGAEPAPTLNNPPKEPEIGIFDAGGARLDGAGPVRVKPGAALIFRQSVQDFETADDAMLFAGFTLSTADGSRAQINPAAGDDGYVGNAFYEGEQGPEGKGDRLNWRFDYTMPAMITMMKRDGSTAVVPSAGLSLTVLAFNVDHDLDKNGMITFSFLADVLKVQP